MIDPSLGAILASGISTALLGYIWYHPKVFGGVWARMSGFTPEMEEKAHRRQPLMALVGIFTAMLIAYVMSYVSAAWGFYNWQGALQLGFWCWAGFVAPILFGSVLWEQRGFRLFLIHALYWLLAFLIMSQFIVFAYSLQYSMYPESALYGAYEGE